VVVAGGGRWWTVVVVVVGDWRVPRSSMYLTVFLMMLGMSPLVCFIVLVIDTSNTRLSATPAHVSKNGAREREREKVEGDGVQQLAHL
jgi:hypothetical protein